mmetsp:Transcript_108028/g.187484  ORF Transcript_108028/g.187484 Transcript_108028/m.187484 type:complete len:98 (-) Transcript_108028:71-364(-)
MNKLLFVLLCLACVGFGRRVQPSMEQSSLKVATDSLHKPTEVKSHSTPEVKTFARTTEGYSMWRRVQALGRLFKHYDGVTPGCDVMQVGCGVPLTAF